MFRGHEITVPGNPIRTGRLDRGADGLRMPGPDTCKDAAPAMSIFQLSDGKKGATFDSGAA
jgi:hypothetical protein